MAQKRFRRVHVLFDATLLPPNSFVDVLRLFPEIDHFCPNTDVHYWVAAPTDRGIGHRFSDFLEERFSDLGMQQRLSKYRTVANREMRARISTVSSIEEILDRLPIPAVIVCRSQETAVTVLELCRERGIQVPDRLAIISLENAPICLHKSITSCIRDWETNGYLMAHALIGDFPVARTKRGFVAAKARVMERATT